MTTDEIIKQYKEKYNLEFDTFSSNNKGFHITFELGDDLENGSEKRTNQAKFRANKIFQSAISENNLCFFEIYDYPNNFFDRKNKYKNYFEKIVNLKIRETYHGPFEQLYSESDENGNEITKVFEDKLECDLILGTETISYSNISKIIEGIVNLEMGKSPIITQDIYIYGIGENVGFRIYDDRGCHIWSSEKEKLKKIYQNLKNWVVENEKGICKKQYE